jgi:hypothetical protein
MATTTQGNYITADSSADLRQKQYHIVKLDSSRKAALATAATDEISGVIAEVHAEGTNTTNYGSVSIAHISGGGTFKVVASTSISKGAYLTATTDGKAVTATQTTAGSQPTVRVFGRALEAANTDGDVIEYEKMFFLY